MDLIANHLERQNDRKLSQNALPPLKFMHVKELEAKDSLTTRKASSPKMLGAPIMSEMRSNIIKKLQVAPIAQVENKWIDEAIKLTNEQPKMKINEIKDNAKMLLQNMNK